MTQTQTTAPDGPSLPRNPRPRNPRKGWRRFFKWTAISVATLIVLALLGWFTFGYVTARLLAHEITAIRTAGEPLTWWELAGLPASPSTQHSRNGVTPEGAGRYYAAALALVTPHQSGEPSDAMLMSAILRASETGGVLDEQQRRDMRRYIEPRRQTLELLHTAAAIDECRFMLHPQLMTHMLDTLRSARMAATLLEFDITLAIAEGRDEDAFRSLVAMLRMSRIFDTQPVLLGYFVQVACETVATRSLGMLLNHGELSTAQLEQLAAMFESLDRADRLRPALMGERVIMLNAMYHAPETNDPDATVSAHYLPWLKMPSAVRRMMLVDALRMQATVIRAAAQPWPVQLNVLRKVRAEGALAELLMPSYGRAAEISGRHLGLTRVARTAIAIEQYRMAEGQPPGGLAQLVPRFLDGVLEDPFTGAALQYRVTPGSYKLYSIGEDGVDDGGVLKDAPHTGAATTGSTTRDWGFEIKTRAGQG